MCAALVNGLSRTRALWLSLASQREPEQGCFADCCQAATNCDPLACDNCIAGEQPIL